MAKRITRKQELEQTGLVTCPRCKARKPRRCFSIDHRNSVGLSSYCKTCRSVQSAQWLRDNPEARERAAARKKARFQAMRDFVSIAAPARGSARKRNAESGVWTKTASWDSWG
jgi:hypothetical protein